MRGKHRTIGPYNTIILKILKSNINIQFVTGLYAMLTYLTSYLCKPEHTMSELMQKALKEAYGKDIKGKMRDIGNVFLTKREVSTHEAIKRVLSLPLRHSNIDVQYVPTGLKENRTRMLKPQSLLEKMDSDDTNVYSLSMLDKYAHRPNNLEQLCYADFASNYISKKVDVDSENIESYTVPVSDVIQVPLNPNCIVLKDNLGQMRKRSRPCVIRFHKVSKLKNPESHYLRIVQLYLPWRNEDELKHEDGTYESKYKEVENEISVNRKRHEPYVDIDYEEIYNRDLQESDNEDEEQDPNFSMFDPNLIDYDEDVTNSTTSGPIAPTTVNDLLLPNEIYYEMCSQLNEMQRNLFNFVMQHTRECRFAEDNAVSPPDPFHIFLSGGAGVGKSFLALVITEFIQRTLKYPGQNLDQPSVLVTASTGKAATGINGITLHSAFNLPIKTPWKSFEYRKPSDEVLHLKRNKYKYLKVLLVDEISMIGNQTFEHLNLALQDVMQNKLLFGGVSVLLIGDLLQLPPVKQQSIFVCARKGTYEALSGSLWEEFQLHELVEIVRQSSDPEFAAILNRVREGKQTDDDVTKIVELENTGTCKTRQ